MIRFIAFIISIFIPAALAAQGSLRFDEAAWDFGSIRETDGPVSHTFTGRNVGDKPLVILDVVTSCGCTVPAFSRQPILPGQQTSVTVTYDPANRPGIFNKELWVYSSERKRIATLRVRGNVAPREKTLEELYPVEAGQGLRLASTLCAFTYLYPGRRVQSSFGCVNASSHKLRLALRPEVESGLLQVDYPRELDPGERAQINVAYLIPADRPRYGTLRDALCIEVDGHRSDIRLVTHGIGVDLPPKADSPAPKAEVSENFIKFGPIRRAGGVQRRTFVVSNAGQADLIVRAVECGDGITLSLAVGQRIAPGHAVRVEVAADPAKHPYGVWSDHLTLVTNDPARPMRRMRVTAIVEE